MSKSHKTKSYHCTLHCTVRHRWEVSTDWCGSCETNRTTQPPSVAPIFSPRGLKHPLNPLYCQPRQLAQLAGYFLNIENQ